MISVKVEGLQATMAYLRGMHKQVTYATSRALNGTAKRVVDAMPEEIRQAIDEPTPFTQKGVGVLSYANRNKLEAIVGFRKIQAAYMLWQIEGGTYTPGNKGLRLPSAVKLNQYGNIPKGVIAGLLALARKDQGAKKAAAKRVKVSTKLELYYGDPVDQTGKVWPRGIYKIVINGTKSSLIPLIVFPKTSAKYKAKFDFAGKATRIVNQVWQSEFDKALADALRTAR